MLEEEVAYDQSGNQFRSSLGMGARLPLGLSPLTLAACAGSSQADLSSTAPLPNMPPGPCLLPSLSPEPRRPGHLCVFVNLSERLWHQRREARLFEWVWKVRSGD